MTRVGVVRQAPTYEPGVVRESVAAALAHAGIQLKSFAAPGMRVVVKPNFIRQSHSSRPDEWEQIITHGTVIAAVAREIARAMEGNGTLTIADGPQTDSDFSLIRERTGLDRLEEEFRRDYPRLDFRIMDLRREKWTTAGGVVVERRRLPDAPGGYVEVDLGENSSFEGKTARYYGADYDTAFTQRNHTSGRHAYLLAKLALDADLFVNIPKLKTHKKVGVTLSLKNLVGINGDKNYLPHFSMGSAEEGGDESPYAGVAAGLQSRGIQAFKNAMHRVPAAGRILGPLAKRVGGAVFGRTEDVIRSGNWYGNDTAWRMVLDLNKILFHYDGSGRRRAKPLRYLSIVDGIIAGEGNGPMEADAKPCGLILAGTNPVAVDLVGATLMDFDWRKIPIIREAFNETRLPLTDFRPEDVSAVPELGKPFQFRAHFGWTGHIEASP